MKFKGTRVSLSPNGIPDQVIAEYDEGVGSVLLVTHMPLIAELVYALSGKRQGRANSRIILF